MDLGNRFVVFIFGCGSRIYSRISIKGFSVKDTKQNASTAPTTSLRIQ